MSSVMQDFNAPTLIVHSQDDMEIPYSHSQTLIDKLLDPLLPLSTVSFPTAPGAHLSTEELLAFRKEQEARSLKRGEIVKKTDVPNFGMVEEFKGLQAPVVYAETFWGAHAQVGLQEGVQDEMGKLFKLGAYGSPRDDPFLDRVVQRLVS
jgi:abhydrolase domain-containing protein 12